MSTLNFPAPGDSNPGDKVQTGDIEWTYSAKGFWYSESSGGGGGFSGDYNDLTNKPNIPPEFNLDEGSYVNDIIHWSDAGSVLQLSTIETGSVNSGNAYTNIAAVGGNGSGLTCNVVRRKNGGQHEVYVATPGEDYQVGDTVFLDLGYDVDTGGTGTTGINCTIDAVNDESGNGWVALPGDDYFVSSSIDSLNTGIPQFMLGTQFGGNPDRRRIDTAAFPVVIEPLGDKATFGIVLTANRDTSGTPRSQCEAGSNATTLLEIVGNIASNNTLDDYIETTQLQRLKMNTTSWQFQQKNPNNAQYNNRFLIDYEGENGTVIKISNGNADSGTRY